MTATDVSSATTTFEPPASTETVPAAQVREPWSLAKRISFRFVASYFLLYSLGSYIGFLPVIGVVGNWYFRAMQALTVWTARNVLHLSASVALVPTGSGDTLRGYVQNFVVLSLAVLGAVVWSILDRRRREYSRAFLWLSAFVRFTLAITMFGYGFAKIIPTQMPAPGPDRWIEPLGEVSPMGLLWTFMGYSYVYQIFTGLGESIGGLLLCFRRTTTAGALLLIAVLSNVVLLNYTFDVPVKLYSTNLLLMVVFLLVPDIKRVLQALVLAPRELEPMLTNRLARRIAIVLVCLQLGVAVAGNVARGMTFYRQTSPTGELPALFGVYDVVEFTRNGVAVPPLSTDPTRWSRVAFARLDRVAVRSTPDSVIRFTTKLDNATKTVSFRGRLDSTLKWTFAIEKSQSLFVPSRDERIVLRGRIGADSIVATLQRVDETRFLLVSRGYHWVQEQPFNR
jgi:hypothetical protein